MALDVLLLPTLGGYWCLTRLYITRYGALRTSGYHILFQSVLIGALMFSLAHVLHHNVLQTWQFYETWETLVPAPINSVQVLSLLLSLPVPSIGNLFTSQKDAARRVANENGRMMELLIVDSIERNELVEVSLASRKSYIGLALKNKVTSLGDSDVSIIPMASGYRDQLTQELKITIFYAPVFQKKPDDKTDTDFNDFRIVIPFSEIVSIRLFKPDAYKKFQEIL